ncbi:MAG: GNAT family N-acetyltransferase [Alphaproteobacteria bacterium]|nr:GNAT family N-acetyltransferase [Alphaproteobacteria bacterium]
MPLVVNETSRRAERADRLNLPERMALDGLVLRRLRIGDEDAIFETYAADPDVCRWLGIKRLPNVENARGFVLRMQEAWESGSEYAYAMVETDDRLFGVISVRIDITTGTFGYVLARSHWGHGHASRALSALADLVLDQPDIWRVQAHCAVENPASARVMEKAGMSREGLLRRYVINPNVALTPTDAYLYAKVRD